MTQQQNFVGAIVGKMLMKKGVEVAVRRGMDALARTEDVALRKADVPLATAVVVDAVKQEVKSRVDHMTDNEPHFKSRNVWGAFVAAVGAVDVMYRLWTDDQLNTPSDYLGPAGIILGILTPLYSRFIAKKPLGE